MKHLILPLITACVLPFSVSLADTTSLPQDWSKEEKALFVSIEDTASDIFSSKKVQGMKTSEQQIKFAFGQLVKSYGKEYRLVIAKAMANLVPEDLHGYVAKRALSYSPLRAKELLASLSQDGANVSSALSSLPTSSVHTSAVADAAGVSISQPGRVFQLPQVDARRRVVSTDSNGRIISASGTGDIGGGVETFSATLGGVQDNGFTLDGQAYAVTGSISGFVGNYLVVVVDPNLTDLHFYFKNKIQNDPSPGAGPDFQLTVLNGNL